MIQFIRSVEPYDGDNSRYSAVKMASHDPEPTPDPVRANAQFFFSYQRHRTEHPRQP